MPRQLTIPDYGLVVLVGTAGAGKTTFAERNFRASEILSSDHYRSVVGDDARSARTTRDAFDVIEAIARRRLRARLVTVIDRLMSTTTTASATSRSRAASTPRCARSCSI